jgi:ADP-ribose pyrophosphatase YjhB (NUDIX family)
MEPRDAYIFCPRCGGKLIKQEEGLHCAACGFVFYINPAPTSAAIIENEHGKILLVERKVDPQKGYWDLPGGFIQTGEELTASVKRELQEELSVAIEVTKVIGIYADRYDFQGIHDYTFGVVVAAKIVAGDLKPADDVASYRFFPKGEVLQQKIAFEGIRKGLEDYLR